MIISRTPLRLSFVGGGTDFFDFYKNDGGAVMSATIDQYMYVTVNKRFDNGIRLSYSMTEIVEHVDQLKHELIREAMKLTGVTEGIEITTIADVPSRGTGLGSSSALTVGALNALYAYKGVYASAERLAREACRIEIDLLKQPIGKQDQYIAAYGGIQHIEFHPNEEVWVDPVMIPVEIRNRLDENLMLFFTGITRQAASILVNQKAKIHQNNGLLKQMREQVAELRRCLCHGIKELDRFGQILHQNWLLKRRLADGISNGSIEGIYTRARKAGAIGGKVAGAGGGGFLLLYCPKERQDSVRSALKEIKELKFRFEPQGSKIVYVS